MCRKKINSLSFINKITLSKYLNSMKRVDPSLYTKEYYLSDCSGYAEYKKKVESFDFRHSWEEIADDFLDLVISNA